MIQNGLLLGLANGLACLATCSAVLIPLFLGEGKRVTDNCGMLFCFITGRLVGYLLFGLLAWVLNWLLLRDPVVRTFIVGPAYLVLAGLLFAYGLGKIHSACALPHRSIHTHLKKLPWIRSWIPALFGLLTGLNLCPPFLLAFTNAALNGTLVGSLGFFFAFFIGTSIYLLPIPLVGLFHRSLNTKALQTIGRFSAALMALYYVISGSLMLVEGVIL